MTNVVRGNETFPFYISVVWREKECVLGGGSVKERRERGKEGRKEGEEMEKATKGTKLKDSQSLSPSI